MKGLNENKIGKCTICGHEAPISEFMSDKDDLVKGDVATTSVKAHCPNCGTPVRFKYLWLQIISLITVLIISIMTMLLFPQYVSYVGYAVGFVFLAIYAAKLTGLVSSKSKFVPLRKSGSESNFL